MIGKYWEHFPHERGVGVRGVGATREQAFEQAAIALCAVVTEPRDVLHLEEVHLYCDAPNDDILLAAWLNGVVHQMAVRQMLFSRFAVQINDHTLRASAWGEELDPAKHQPAAEVKGVAYEGALVREDETGTWLAQCVILL